MFHTFQTPSPAKSSLLLPQNSGIFQKVGGTFRIPQAALPSREWKTTVFAVEGNRIHIGLLGSFQQNHHEDLTSKPKSCSGVPQPTPHSVLTASQTRRCDILLPHRSPQALSPGALTHQMLLLDPKNHLLKSKRKKESSGPFQCGFWALFSGTGPFHKGQQQSVLCANSIS